MNIKLKKHILIKFDVEKPESLKSPAYESSINYLIILSIYK